jgi:hypothetical protein
MLRIGKGWLSKMFNVTFYFKCGHVMARTRVTESDRVRGISYRGQRPCKIVVTKERPTSLETKYNMFETLRTTIMARGGRLYWYSIPIFTYNKSKKYAALT